MKAPWAQSTAYRAVRDLPEVTAWGIILCETWFALRAARHV